VMLTCMKTGDNRLCTSSRSRVGKPSLSGPTSPKPSKCRHSSPQQLRPMADSIVPIIMQEFQEEDALSRQSMPKTCWHQVLAINLTGVWLCMKYEIPQMLSQGSGAIVNTASVAGLIGGRRTCRLCGE